MQLTACSRITAGKANDLPPAPLKKSEQKVKLHPMWAVPIGNGTLKHYVKLKVEHKHKAIFTADPEGMVTAVAGKSGALIWQTQN